ncbi:MAG: hypothetical protein JWO62_1539 [Acidimicrobiaceae bacterium]|jgi:hypothetical protein|nr:hypothetical protein [Acidimicrobiaceae bacterium]
MPTDRGRRATAERSWEQALDDMEHHLDEVRAALERRGVLAEPYTVEGPATPMPQHLLERAKLLLAGQRDVEIVLRERVGILDAALHRDPLAAHAVVSLYLDRSA